METSHKQINKSFDQIISFKIGNEEYGIEILKVKEVIRFQEITRLPKTPNFVKGVINLRGDVIPIIDLREKFGLSQHDYNELTRVIVVEVDGKSVGMVVDSVSHVIRIGEDQIDSHLLIGEISGDYVRGVGKLDDRLIVLLDFDRILTTEEKIELKQINDNQLEGGN
ncbi:chemotaxis protein CheW [Archaeoglobales archaeon]|nr:MAG: chemotaxis protein CheW [Archaeoglobales archaeon]